MLRIAPQDEARGGGADHSGARCYRSRKKLIEIGAKAVGHAHSVAFQMAGVAISKDLFAGILRMIA